MGDSLTTIIAIFLAAILMFVFPLMSLSERTDDMSELSVKSATDEFVNDIKTTGKITLDKYEKYLQKITATGNTFDVEMKLYNLDENPGVKLTQAEMTKIGENLYYVEYTTQIQNKLTATNGTGSIKLKEGDMITVTVRNTNLTIAQLLRNFFYRIAGDNSYPIAAERTAIITVNGSSD